MCKRDPIDKACLKAAAAALRAGAMIRAGIVRPAESEQRVLLLIAAQTAREARAATAARAAPISRARLYSVWHEIFGYDMPCIAQLGRIGIRGLP